MKIPEFLKAGFVSSSPWLLALVFLSYAGAEINSRINAAAYALPRAIVSYGLTNAKNDDDVIATVEVWKRDAWGAQIGSLRVLCENDRDYVNSLGGSDVGARVCRITK
ncbi:hypothetical protein PEC301619_12760 [Pectobacterium carotovorum subsp. carotovorum]|nr:hypothetical protein PEC301619_12760 [Pectobacterium carotovorum subsp. carotovorum]